MALDTRIESEIILNLGLPFQIPGAGDESGTVSDDTSQLLNGVMLEDHVEGGTGAAASPSSTYLYLYR